MHRVDEELAAVLGVPHRLSGTIKDKRIVAYLDGEIEGAFTCVVSDAKVGVQVIFTCELVAEFDPFDAIRL